MNKVFLGGTCNDSAWREELIPLLKIKFFNPVVEDWTPECMEMEVKQRQFCDYCLYVITPFKTGDYAIAEAVDDSNKRPHKTVFCVLEQDGRKQFTKGQLKSLDQVGKMIESNGGLFYRSLQDVANWLNNPISA